MAGEQGSREVLGKEDKRWRECTGQGKWEWEG